MILGGIIFAHEASHFRSRSELLRLLCFFPEYHGKRMVVEQFEKNWLQEHLKIVRILTIIVAGIADVNNTTK